MLPFGVLEVSSIALINLCATFLQQCPMTTSRCTNMQLEMLLVSRCGILGHSDLGQVVIDTSADLDCEV
eukprot:5441555-Amphidinium_carterae.1